MKDRLNTDAVIVFTDVMSTTTAQVGCETCGHLACVCGIRREHDEECKFRIAATGSVGIECSHGRDVCPVCDPCTCP